MGNEVDILTAISQVGFPIAVAAFSLIKLNATIEKNTKVLNAIYTKLSGEVPKDE